MAEQPMIEISQNDNLERVIRICNTNFRAISANSKISTGTISDDVAREMAAMAQAFNEELDSEARIRASADDDLEDMITGLDTHFLPTTGGTITGDLDIEGDAFSNQEQFYFTFKTTDHTQYTPVASPCFVLDTTEMDLYYYDNGSYSHLTNNSSASVVTGVKGDAESAYRTGNVNLTPDDIGAAKKSEAIKNITRSGTTFTATRTDDTTFTFTQQDNNSLTGVKGNAETNYRTGNVNLTAANIGAAASSHSHSYLPLSGGNMTGKIQREKPDGISYIAGCTGGALHVNKAEGSIWFPMVSTRTGGGGGWAIGNYNNENLQFSYGTKANINANNNSTKIIDFYSDGGCNFPNTIKQNGTAVSLSGHKHGAGDITSGTLPISRGGTGATAANTARTNLTAAKRATGLYGNWDGTTDLTLSQTCANFDHIKIYYKTNDGQFYGHEVYSPNGRVICLMGGYFDSNGPGANCKGRFFLFSGTRVSPYQGGAEFNAASTAANNNAIKIIRVEGYYEGN